MEPYCWASFMRTMGARSEQKNFEVVALPSKSIH